MKRNMKTDGDLVMIFPDNSVCVFHRPQINADWHAQEDFDRFGFPIVSPYRRCSFEVATDRTISIFRGGYKNTDSSKSGKGEKC